MKLAVTIDVEEEGLFRNAYDPGNASVANVPELHRLDAVFREFGIRPTLLVTYRVACQSPNQEFLLDLQDRWKAEIGAHLHHWNTPPLQTLPHPDPVPSQLIPAELLQAKMDSLLELLRAMRVSPVSFRMGRFNMGSGMFSVLERTGFKVDSSMAPLRRYYGGPDHLFVPVDPYFPDPADPRRRGTSWIVEAPITIVPITGRLGQRLDGLREWDIVPDRWISWFAMNLGSLPVQPAWTGLRRLKAAAVLHQMRGGRVLTMFFHSSELMPGATPLHRTDEEVNQFVEKLRRFFSWLFGRFAVDSVTLSELGELYRTHRVT